MSDSPGARRSPSMQAAWSEGVDGLVDGERRPSRWDFIKSVETAAPDLSQPSTGGGLFAASVATVETPILGGNGHRNSELHARASLALNAFAQNLIGQHAAAAPDRPRHRPVRTVKRREARLKKPKESNEAMLRRFMPGEHNASRSTRLQKATIAGQRGQRVSRRINDHRHLLERTTLTVARLKIASKLRKVRPPPASPPPSRGAASPPP